MKLTPFAKIIAMSKEKLESALAGPRARQTRIQGELEMAKIDEKIATSEQEITELCSKHPLDFNTLIDKLDKVALMERRKKQFEKVLSELFPKE